MDAIYRTASLRALSASDTAERTQSTNNTNPDDLLLNLVSTEDPITTETANSDQFQDMRNNYMYIDPSVMENIMRESGAKLEGSSSQYNRDQGTYRKALAPVFGQLLRAIQSNDAQGIYNALSQALELSTTLSMKRGNAAGGGGAQIRGMEANIYKNVLNDPNMINLKNPQHAFQFFSQIMMWTNGGSLTEFMFNMSQNLGANTQFVDPLSQLSNYNY
jgi:hypothetical protein